MNKHSSSTRRYPRNSPQAAANFVALALISNGEVKPSEVAVLEAMRVHEQLGLTRLEWHDVVHELCIDLLWSAAHGTDCRIDGRMIEQVYLSAFGRFPSETEKQRAVELLKASRLEKGTTEALLQSRRQGAEDLMWALLTSKEFLFNQ